MSSTATVTATTTVKQCKQAPQVTNQLPNPLPPVTASITAHDSKTQQAVFHQPEQDSRLLSWHPPLANGQMAFFTLYQTLQVPVHTGTDLDLTHHSTFMDNPKHAAGPALVVANGTVCRMVDFAPGYSTVNHRSHSVDYGVVVEGRIELVLDSGQTRVLERGGMALQRGTMHYWRNPSQSEWTRMFFVLVSAEARTVAGVTMAEDLGGL